MVIEIQEIQVCQKQIQWDKNGKRLVRTLRVFFEVRPMAVAARLEAMGMAVLVAQRPVQIP